MKKMLVAAISCTAILMASSDACIAQVIAPPPLSQNASDTTRANAVTDTAVLHWLRGLYQPGVEMQNDSLILNEEARKLFSDEAYRQLMYPSVYSWEMAKKFIQTQNLKQAFWYFINLYMVNDKNKELVIKAVLTYNKFLNMDKILVSTFYTYTFADPEIVALENGTTKVVAPHVMEKKLYALKEILFYLDKYKSTAGENPH